LKLHTHADKRETMSAEKFLTDKIGKKGLQFPSYTWLMIADMLEEYAKEPNQPSDLSKKLDGSLSRMENVANDALERMNQPQQQSVEGKEFPDFLYRSMDGEIMMVSQGKGDFNVTEDWNEYVKSNNQNIREAAERQYKKGFKDALSLVKEFGFEAIWKSEMNSNKH